MPTIGGVNIGYDVNTPSDVESAGLGDDRIRSLKTSLQQALDAEHNFPAGGGANTGYHALGSARPYVGAQSLVSSSGSDGRLMMTSDTSRLFGGGSGGTVLLGGWGSLSVDTTTGVSWPQRSYWACEFGNHSIANTGPGTVTFPNSGFSGIPFVQISVVTTAAGASAVFVVVQSLTATGFNWQHYSDTGGSPASGAAINWLSIGTRTL